MHRCGYIHDVETNLYYLQSRYYDPEIGRFINADAYISTGQGLLGNNMFAYCLNNPVCYFDPLGSWVLPTWEDIQEWLEESVDDFVHAALEATNPIGTAIAKGLHYNRNVLNKAPKTESEAEQLGYTLLDENNDKFHQNNQNGGRNKKYVSSDGHHEAVYYNNGQLNDTPEDIGTYNVGSSTGGFFERYIVHGIVDVLPYMLWGNSPKDDSTIIGRIGMAMD